MDDEKTVTRWVITHISDETGLRTLTLSAQGKDTFATRSEAEHTLALCRGPYGLVRVLSMAEFGSLAVRPCTCWPGHFDPCGIYFD